MVLSKQTLSLNRFVRVLLTLLAVAAAAKFGTTSRFYMDALRGSFFSCVLLSVSIIHFRVFPTVRDASSALAATLLFGFVDFRLLGFAPRFAAWFSFLGISSLLLLTLHAVWSNNGNRKLAALAFVPALLFVTSEWFASNMLDWTEKLHPRVLDLYLYSFDGSLHVQPAILMGQAFRTWPWFWFISIVFYVGLPIPIALVYAGQLVRRGDKALAAMVAFLLTGPLGVLFYNIFPALGPAHLLHQAFPWHSLTIEQIRRVHLESVALPGMRNAIPSLHMAWVLLAWWYSRGLARWERSIVFAFVAFTACATLGTGEHYFVDLVVAFPFALLVKGLCTWSLPCARGERLNASLFGFFATLGWLAVLRLMNGFFWTSPVVPWILSSGTVALTILEQQRLDRAASGAHDETATVETALGPLSLKADRLSVVE